MMACSNYSLTAANRFRNCTRIQYAFFHLLSTPTFPLKSARTFTSSIHNNNNSKIKVDNINDFNELRERRITFSNLLKSNKLDKKFTTPKDQFQDELNYQNDIKEYLSDLLNVKNLYLTEINLSCTADVLNHYVHFETVLAPANTQALLEKRLGYGRRVYSLNHPLLESFPLAFVNIALTDRIADSLEYIDMNTGTVDLEKNANTAMFYSICTAPGLHGFSFGNFLIKSAVEKLKSEVFVNSQLKYFSTLSPIPNFRKWLENENPYDAVNVVLGHADFVPNTVFGSGKTGRLYGYNTLSQFGREKLIDKIYNVKNGNYEDDDYNLARLPLAAHYLIDKKSNKNSEQALCPVANFHLSNGAILHRLNSRGDMSNSGIKRSFGMMVNYLYDLNLLNKNSKNYKERGIIKSDIGWGL
jgi:malonyl-CoA decarboxylase